LKPQKRENSENFNIFGNDIICVENAKVVIVGSVFFSFIFSFGPRFPHFMAKKKKRGSWVFLEMIF